MNEEERKVLLDLLNLAMTAVGEGSYERSWRVSNIIRWS
jgi:hypothetical protein